MGEWVSVWGGLSMREGMHPAHVHVRILNGR